MPRAVNHNQLDHDDGRSDFDVYHVDNDPNPEFDEPFINLHERCDNDCADDEHLHVHVIPVEHVARRHVLANAVHFAVVDLVSECNDPACDFPHALVALERPAPRDR